ncbi:MAG: polysaccharide biosynthesis tyrosine autokinase [Ruminococcus sp.]|uniref:polysaccharide biosynthesis tyrosine autokinase n=1 Tax=Ruminococcus sp. TaxID=41978 RepID=UPI0025F0D5C5|nr:polysaccharide biosynthesis tyrosine autokinase [Ruminococcus sp.]MCR5600742.1 polysaccharide biosynthesis tyrosine autokinase [Ruminococcus sp.]
MNNDSKEIDLKDLFSLFISKLWIIILAVIIGGAGAFCYSKFVLPLKYSSHISMYVQSYTSFNENPDLNYNNINNSKQLINTYMEVLKDDAVMNAVGDKLSASFDENILSESLSVVNGKITPSSIRECMVISSVTDTSALNLVTTTKNAELSAAICNIVAKVAPSYLDEAVGVGQINTIDTAKVYNTPVSPNVKKNTAIGGLAAAFLVMVILFLIDFFDNTIKESGWLGSRFKKAIIGEILEFGTDRKKNAENDSKYVKLTDKDVPFAVVESYKSIRTNISFALSPFEKKIFTVSSTNPGDGKSTTSANIAIALSQGGNKVLLIDADLRKCVQHKIFGLKNKKGLSTAISRMADLDECISKDVMDNLDVMTAGPIPPNPSELLASESMTSILEKLSERYATIIIDTPPVNVVTDSMELAKNVSGIIMVVRYGVTTTDDIDAAMKKIEFSQMNMLGFIMNDIKSKHGGKYYSKYKYKYYKYKKGYGYGYGYGYGTAHEENEDDSSDTDEKKDTAPKKESSSSSGKSDTASKKENSSPSDKKKSSGSHHHSGKSSHSHKRKKGGK